MRDEDSRRRVVLSWSRVLLVWCRLYTLNLGQREVHVSDDPTCKWCSRRVWIDSSLLAARRRCHDRSTVRIRTRSSFALAAENRVAATFTKLAYL